MSSSAASKALESSFVINVLRVICIGMFVRSPFVRLLTYVRTLLGSYGCKFVRSCVRAFVCSCVRTFLCSYVIGYYDHVSV